MVNMIDMDMIKKPRVKTWRATINIVHGLSFTEVLETLDNLPLPIINDTAQVTSMITDAAAWDRWRWKWGRTSVYGDVERNFKL